MSTLQDMLGVSPSGLGTNMMAMNTQQNQDTSNQQNLAEMFLKQQQANAAQQQNKENLLTADSRVQATNAENLGKVTSSNVEGYQKAGELAGQLSGAIGNLPPEQRVRALQQVAQKLPGIGDSPVFQQLMQGDPNDLPQRLKQLGQDIALKASSFQQQSGIQTQKDDSAMGRLQFSESQANARNAASNATSTANSKRAAANANRDAKTYEAAAIQAVQAAQSATDPAEREHYMNIAQAYSEEAQRAKAAGVAPGIMADDEGGFTSVAPQGANAAGFRRLETQSSIPNIGNQVTEPGIPAGFPEGSKALGGGRIQLPDGRILKPKQ